MQNVALSISAEFLRQFSIKSNSPYLFRRATLAPLHAEKGRPLRCYVCIGAWHAKHGRRRKVGRVVISAIKTLVDGGGSWNESVPAAPWLDRPPTRQTIQRDPRPRLCAPRGGGASRDTAWVRDRESEGHVDRSQPSAGNRGFRRRQRGLNPSTE
jgi:hypothetical protein